MGKTEKIFTNIVNEASTGNIVVGNKSYNIRFDVLYESGFRFDNGFNRDAPILIIRNREKLISLLEKYLDTLFEVKKISNPTDDDIKLHLAFLWYNACFSDFSNPENYISRLIRFYLNDNLLLSNQKNDLCTHRKSGKGYDETPYTFEVSYGDEKRTILYGIDNDECYLYGIKNDNDSIFSISSIIIFLKQMVILGINKMKVASYLPLKGLQNFEQFNDYFRMISYYFDGVKILNDPFEEDEYMHVYVSELDVEPGAIAHQMFENRGIR